MPAQKQKQQKKQKRQQQGRLIGGFLLMGLVAVLALAVGAWIGGWRPPTDWQLPGVHWQLPDIDKSKDLQPHEVISDTERRSLDRVLREQKSGKDN